MTVTFPLPSPSLPLSLPLSPPLSSLSPSLLLQAVMRDLLPDMLPRLSAHLQQHTIDVTLVTFNWFLTLFVDAMPTEVSGDTHLN